MTWLPVPSGDPWRETQPLAPHTRSPARGLRAEEGQARGPILRSVQSDLRERGQRHPLRGVLSFTQQTYPETGSHDCTRPGLEEGRKIALDP